MTIGGSITNKCDEFKTTVGQKFDKMDGKITMLANDFEDAKHDMKKSCIKATHKMKMFFMRKKD